MKRALDVILGVVAAVLMAPVMLGIGLLVRITLGRPVLFRQRRPGARGELFTLYKFRTMSDGAGSDAERLGSIGQCLRSTSLDELPQIWNVLRGDMSFVGPRPLLPEYLPLYTRHHARRHEVRPGLTGLAQVVGRNDTTWERRLDLDVRYVDERSMWLDLKILAMTVWRVLSRQGVAPAGSSTMPKFEGLVSGRG